MARAAARPAPSEGEIATKAVVRAAARLGLSNRVLSRVIGLSEASVSRMGSGGYTLSPGEKPFELAMLLIRLFRSLDALADGDEAVARAWLAGENQALGAAPVTLLPSVQGLMHVIEYLDSRRALA